MPLIRHIEVPSATYTLLPRRLMASGWRKMLRQASRSGGPAARSKAVTTGSEEEDEHTSRSISKPERKKMMARAAARICLDQDGTRPEIMAPLLTLRSIMPDKIMASAPGKCSYAATASL